MLCRLLFVLVIFAGKFSPRAWCAADEYREEPGTEGNGDFVIGPEYQTDHDLMDQGKPKGKSFEFSLPLAESKIYRGDDKRRPVSAAAGDEFLA